jgi:hypothetical protein
MIINFNIQIVYFCLAFNELVNTKLSIYAINIR